VAFIPPALAAQQGNGAVTFSVSAASQKDAPVQAVGFVRGLKADGTPAVIIKNFSDRQVAAVRLNVHYAAPCSQGKPQSWHHEYASPQRIVIEPESEAAWTRDELLNTPAYLGILRATGSSTFLHTEVAVAAVRFADGSSWEASMTAKDAFITTALLDEDRKHCSEYPGNPALSAITHVSFSDKIASALPSLSTEGNPVRTFVIRCVIADSSTLICPEH
ncbi:MAG: hypothetical protein ACRD3E_07350, partial [Terriglobales bacterium]